MQKKRKKQAKIKMWCYERKKERKKERRKKEDEKQELELAEGFRRINNSFSTEIVTRKVDVRTFSLVLLALKD